MKLFGILTISLMLVLLAGGPGAAGSKPAQAPKPAPQLTYPMIGVEEFAKLVADSLAGQEVGLIVDVRSPAEFDAGHIQGTDHIPMSLVRHMEQIIKDKKARVTLFCRTKNRSTRVAQTMVMMGYENVTVYGGGIVNWIKSGREMVNAYMGKFKVTEYHKIFQGRKLDPARIRVRPQAQ